MSTYAERLQATRLHYPFARWKEAAADYTWTVAECDQLTEVFDRLLARLEKLGEDAPEKKKVKNFRKTVDDLNDWMGGIDTLAREDLPDLLYEVAGAAGVAHYDDLDEGRDW